MYVCTALPSPTITITITITLTLILTLTLTLTTTTQQPKLTSNHHFNHHLLFKFLSFASFLT
jgi:hypothetical protein